MMRVPMDVSTVDTIEGTRRWSMKVDLAGRPPEDAYDMVAAQMYKMLENILQGGWSVVGKPEVEETYDFLRDCSTLIATVTLRDKAMGAA